MITRRTVLCCALMLAVLGIGASAQSPTATVFPSPEDAVKALADTVKKGDADALLAIFGTDGKDLVASSDPATARMNRQIFAVAFKEQWHLADGDANHKTLVIGNENWPFPVPLIKEANGWRFDSAAGKEEIIARRIGQNELAAIDTAHAYVSAQHRYAAEGHDGNQPGAYAMQFQSDAGKQNGLYWPAAHGQKRSPLGDLLAQAAEERHASGAERVPLHGYYFKILSAQGSAAKGGAKGYVVKNRMTGGFALIAWPAQYDVTGVMTFIVNQDGVVRQKDLGPQSAELARKVTTYNPDASWQLVK
jgi:hypothetical protein